MIPGFSDVTRLPRLGKIRLGEKKISQGGKEYPAALDHMSLEDVPWVAEALGVATCHDDKSGKPTCKSLEVVFPLDEEHIIFPQARKAYRQSGLFCVCGDGKSATRVRVEDNKDEQGEAFIAEQGLEVKVGEMFELPCPGDDCPYWTAKHCKPIGRLLFMLPNVPRLGVYEITTSSWNSMVNVNSYFAFVRALAGRISMIPFRLTLRPQEVQPQGKKKTVYVLDLTFEGSVEDLQRMRAVGRARALPEGRVEVPSEAELDKNFPDDLFVQQDAPGAREEHAEAVAAAHARFDPPQAEPAPAATKKPARAETKPAPAETKAAPAEPKPTQAETKAASPAPAPAAAKKPAPAKTVEMWR